MKVYVSCWICGSQFCFLQRYLARFGLSHVLRGDLRVLIRPISGKADPPSESENTNLLIRKTGSIPHLLIIPIFTNQLQNRARAVSIGSNAELHPSRQCFCHSMLGRLLGVHAILRGVDILERLKILGFQASSYDPNGTYGMIAAY